MAEGSGDNGKKSGQTDQFADKTSDERKALVRHIDALGYSVDYCKPHFDKFVRLIELYSGKVPDELDVTLSKVMPRIPFAMIQNEIPRIASTLFEDADFFDIEANEKDLEFAKDDLKDWLRYQVQQKNAIFPKVLPTLTRVGITGNGYRSVTHTPIYKKDTKRNPTGSFAGIPYGFREETKLTQEFGISAQNVDVFQVMPAPNGHEINCYDQQSEEALEYLHWIDYMSKEKLQALQKKSYANAREISKMIGQPVDGYSDELAIDTEYRERARSAMHDDDVPDWMATARSEGKKVTQRFRCVWTFFRDTWMLVGENKFLLYNGPPLIDWIPIAHYVDTPDLNTFFGIGMMETVEDIILAYILNYNLRLDYLAATMHPSTFVRDDIAKANTTNINGMDPTPYSLYTFPKSVQNIQTAIWRDRFPEISPQAFMEDTSFRQLLQEVSAQPNYMKGMGGSSTLANETATGIVSLIEEGTARSSMRSLNVEYSGLREELMLTLKWGKKYVGTNQEIRLKRKGTPWRWTEIDHRVIDDRYGIELKGTRNLAHKQEMVRRMMNVMPMLLGNQNLPGQRELLEEMLNKVGVFDNIEGMLGPETPSLALPPGGFPGPGVGGEASLANQNASFGNAIPQAAAAIA